MMRIDRVNLKLSRRSLIAGALAAAAMPLRADLSNRLQIATMDGVLKLEGKPEALAMAKKLGLSAVQVTLGVSTDEKHFLWKTSNCSNSISAHRSSKTFQSTQPISTCSMSVA